MNISIKRTREHMNYFCFADHMNKELLLENCPCSSTSTFTVRFEILRQKICYKMASMVACCACVMCSVFVVLLAIK